MDEQQAKNLAMALFTGQLKDMSYLSPDPEVQNSVMFQPEPQDIAEEAFFQPDDIMPWGALSKAGLLGLALAGVRPVSRVAEYLPDAVKLAQKRVVEPVVGAADDAATVAISDMAREMELNDLAKTLYGTTKNRKEAGYILSDGAMLDLSGKSQAGADYVRVGDHYQPKAGIKDYLADQRSIDHRQFPEELWDRIESVEKNPTSVMDNFMEQSRAIRFTPEGYAAQINRMPTDDQIAKLAALAPSGEPLLLDVYKPGGRELAFSAQVEKPTFEVLHSMLQRERDLGNLLPSLLAPTALAAALGQFGTEDQ